MIDLAYFFISFSTSWFGFKCALPRIAGAERYLKNKPKKSQGQLNLRVTDTSAEHPAVLCSSEFGSCPTS